MSGTPWVLQIPGDITLTDAERVDLYRIPDLLPRQRGLLVIPEQLNAGVSNLDRIWRAAILNRRDDLHELLSKQPSVDDIWYAAGDLARAALDERLSRIIDGRKP